MGVRLQPTHDFMQGVCFTNELGEVYVHPVSRMHVTYLTVLCVPKAKEEWGIQFSLFAPGASEALLAALRTICWQPLMDLDKTVLSTRDGKSER